MAKYFCYECNHGFDHPERIEEVRDVIRLGSCSYAYTETMFYCPHCGGEGFVCEDDDNTTNCLILLAGGNTND